MNFVPGGSDLESGHFGKKIENGEYIGLVRIWAGDRRIDWKLRVKDEELEEKRDFYFKGDSSPPVGGIQVGGLCVKDSRRKMGAIMGSCRSVEGRSSPDY
jgi:hypothetical protein